MSCYFLHCLEACGIRIFSLSLLMSKFDEVGTRNFTPLLGQRIFILIVLFSCDSGGGSF